VTNSLRAAGSRLCRALKGTFAEVFKKRPAAGRDIGHSKTLLINLGHSRTSILNIGENEPAGTLRPAD
jgi:hypothetical protein